MAGNTSVGSRLRRVGAAAGGGVLVLTALASCGSNTIDPATVYLTSAIGPSLDPMFASKPCQIDPLTTQLVAGTVQSGIVTGTNSTTITCSVISSGSGYAVNIEVDTEEGSFAITGTMPKSGTATSITMASLDYDPGGEAAITYNSTGNCSVTMANNDPGTTTPGFDPSTGPPIAPGRVWATVTCEDMTVTDQPMSVCEGVLTFRMENCVGSPTN
jgi:hypothetical protein